MDENALENLDLVRYTCGQGLGGDDKGQEEWTDFSFQWREPSLLWTSDMEGCSMCIGPGYFSAGLVLAAVMGRHAVALCQLIGAVSLQAPVLHSTHAVPLNQDAFGDFPRKDALDARLPPPTSRHALTRDRSHDLTVARPALSPVE